MGLRTAEQYKQSLRDGRAVFFRGEKVADVTRHPVIGIAVEHACIDYRMAEDPKYRELAVMRQQDGPLVADRLGNDAAFLVADRRARPFR